MNNTKIHPMAEAKVQTRPTGSAPDAEWRDALDFDPIMIPVELDGLTDPFADVVMRLVDAVITADTDASNINPDFSPINEFNIVWSATGHTVKANCPVCDDVFPLAEGAPGDELNEGYDAVFCGGCEPDEED